MWMYSQIATKKVEFLCYDLYFTVLVCWCFFFPLGDDKNDRKASFFGLFCSTKILGFVKGIRLQRLRDHRRPLDWSRHIWASLSESYTRTTFGRKRMESDYSVRSLFGAIGTFSIYPVSFQHRKSFASGVHQSDGDPFRQIGSFFIDSYYKNSSRSCSAWIYNESKTQHR